MDEALLRQLVTRRHLPEPGDSTSISLLEERNGAMEVAVVQHHRLAFYYWLKWSTHDWTRSLSTHDPAADLLTIDWHDDVGCEADCDYEELRSLMDRLEVDDVNDPASLDDAGERRLMTQNNVIAYSFLGLRSINDGHIYPAQYLNAIGNVFVLYKQWDKQSSEMTDMHGNKHETHYVKTLDDLLKRLRRSGRRPIYFDLDIDYFFREGKGKVQGAEVMVPEQQIRDLLDLQGPLMSEVRQRSVQGMTIALEPAHCGGLSGCFRAMSVVSETLLDGSLLGDKVDWRKPKRRARK
jgi:hypothetical protein